MPNSNPPRQGEVSKARPLAALARRLWSKPRSRNLVLYVLVALLVLVASRLPDPEDAPLARMERAAFDTQMEVLRSHWPRLLEDDIVLVGIDEGSEETFTEPVALWHKHFARLFSALAGARPRAVGVDVVPPERSYDDIAPGYDLAFFRAIRDLRSQTVVVFALTVDREGRAARMHPTFARVIGEEGLGVDQQWRDPDSVLRRFSEPELGKTQAARTLAGQLLRGLGLPVDEGFIDYSIGSRAEYIPMQDVIAWKEQGEESRLRETFGGKIVLVGYVLKRADRWELPVQLIDIDPDNADGRARLSQPGVITHMQVLRSHFAQRPAEAGRRGVALDPVSSRRGPRVLPPSPGGSTGDRRRFDRASSLVSGCTPFGRTRCSFLSRRSYSRSGPESSPGESWTASRTPSSEGGSGGPLPAR